jgi:large subunit ribosomal protein L18Ae
MTQTAKKFFFFFVFFFNLFVFLSQVYHEYHIVGRRKPSPTQPNPTLLRMTIFARNKVEAKSRFFYISSRLKNLKKANGEILACSERFDTSPERVKNFGIFLRYNSRSGTHNMYKEYRATTRAGAVEKLYNDMAGRHRARRETIQIMRVDAIPASKCRREGVKAFHNSKIRFALARRVQRLPKHKRSTFVASRPTTVASL